MFRAVCLKVIPKNSLNLYEISELRFSAKCKADFNEE